MAKTVSAIHELHKSAAVAELCRARWQVAEKHKLGRVTKHIKIRTRHKIVVTERMLAKTGIPTGMQTHPLALPTRAISCQHYGKEGEEPKCSSRIHSLFSCATISARIRPKRRVVRQVDPPIVHGHNLSRRTTDRGPSCWEYQQRQDGGVCHDWVDGWRGGALWPSRIKTKHLGS